MHYKGKFAEDAEQDILGLGIRSDHPESSIPHLNKEYPSNYRDLNILIKGIYSLIEGVLGSLGRWADPKQAARL